MRTIDRVRQAIRERHLLADGDPVLVAVSGGPDSLALLHLLNILAAEFRLNLQIAHFNHMLRGSESDADAAFVGEIAEKWGLRVTIGAQPVRAYAESERLSLEEAARILRYRFLAETAAAAGARSIALGHNADDQVETILMHFLRGSGLAGLRGMLYRAPLAPELVPAAYSGSLWLVRPLLGISRLEIEAYCEEHSLAARQDSSNLELTPFRNRLRHEILPQLEALNPNLREVLRHSAETISDDYAYLEQQVRAEYSRIAREQGRSVIFDRSRWVALAPALQRGTLREAVRHLRSGLRDLNWIHVESARRAALDGRTGTEATLPEELVLRVGYGEFSIAHSLPIPEAPQIAADSIQIPLGSRPIDLGGNWRVQVEGPLDSTAAALTAERDRWCVRIDADRVDGEMLLRPRRPSDRFQPEGLLGHTKSIHDFMIDEKIPRAWRSRLPLLCDSSKILWVCGYRLDERVKPVATTRRLYRISFTGA